MTFLKKLRDAARECSNKKYRTLLMNAADRVDTAIGNLYALPSEENMIALNGAWSVAEFAWRNRPQEGDPSPQAGSPEPALVRSVENPKYSQVASTFGSVGRK